MRSGAVLLRWAPRASESQPPTWSGRDRALADVDAELSALEAACTEALAALFQEVVRSEAELAV